MNYNSVIEVVGKTALFAISDRVIYKGSLHNGKKIGMALVSEALTKYVTRDWLVKMLKLYSMVDKSVLSDTIIDALINSIEFSLLEKILGHEISFMHTLVDFIVADGVGNLVKRHYSSYPAEQAL